MKYIYKSIDGKELKSLSEQEFAQLLNVNCYVTEGNLITLYECNKYLPIFTKDSELVEAQTVLDQIEESIRKVSEFGNCSEAEAISLLGYTERPSIIVFGHILTLE